METQKPALNAVEAAAYLGFTKNYLHKLVHQKKIAYYKPLNGKLFFRVAELDAFLFRNRQAANYEKEAANA